MDIRPEFLPFNKRNTVRLFLWGRTPEGYDFWWGYRRAGKHKKKGRRALKEMEKQYHAYLAETPLVDGLIKLLLQAEKEKLDPHKLARRALRHCSPERHLWHIGYVTDTKNLLHKFTWGATPEGHRFWSAYWQKGTNAPRAEARLLEMEKEYREATTPTARKEPQ